MSNHKSTELVLGTAGHIDHGKSALVLALTGTDPDRLAEEKERGITIELGFARLTLPDGSTMSVVDVPGHERFVRQMIAGSTGIDVAMLCIAADDGIMPQTEEHLAVLELLGVPQLVIALTKIDLVDKEWIRFVEDEIRSFLVGSPYEDAPIVAVSSKTGEGLEALKNTIQAVVGTSTSKRKQQAVRMPIDRVFTIKGVGTVVTGTLWSGTIALDDFLEVLSEKLRTRIRSIQIHGEERDKAFAGNRVALNLHGLTTKQVRPGDFLASVGSLESTDRFDAVITNLGSKQWDRPMETGEQVHIAHGTREVLGRILLMDGQGILPIGEKALVQVRLQEPLPVSPKDRFIIRSLSPVYVIGGGEVLLSHPRHRTMLSEQDRKLLKALKEDDAQEAIEAALSMAQGPTSVDALAKLTGLNTDDISEIIDELLAQKKLLSLGKFVILPSYLQKFTNVLDQELVEFHGAQPNSPGIPKEALRQRLAKNLEKTPFDAILNALWQSGKITIDDGLVSHPKASSKSKQNDERAAQKLFDLLAQAGHEPPVFGDLIRDANIEKVVGERALRSLEKQGTIIKVGKDFYFTKDAVHEIEDAIRTVLEKGPATASQLREAMNTSRKYAIPLLEYFDVQGITRRKGDLRELNQ